MSDSKNISVSFTSDHFNKPEQKGIEIKDREPRQEDFGWYLNFKYHNTEYCDQLK